MAKAPRRPKPAPPAPRPHARPPSAPRPLTALGPRPGERDLPARHPLDVLEERRRGPEAGALREGLRPRVHYPAELKRSLARTGRSILEGLRARDEGELWWQYERLASERERQKSRGAFLLGYDQGAAEGRAERFRGHAPGVGARARRIADQARALVVSAGLSPAEATAVLLETAWALVLSGAAPEG